MQKLTKGKFDFLIFITVIILVLFGCVMVYSASYYSATIEEGDPAYYFKKQLLLAHAQALAKQAAGANGIVGLDQLPRIALGIRPWVQKYEQAL